MENNWESVLDEVADKRAPNTIDVNEEWEEILVSLRHGMSKKDWTAYRRAFNELKDEWIMQNCPWGGDYYYSEILEILKFKIERMIEYWEQFGHCSNGPKVVITMRTTCRLIDIVLNRGNECGDYDEFPYRVNMRNAERFLNQREHDEYHHHGEKQKVRYYKAYSLLFRFLEIHLPYWWD